MPSAMVVSAGGGGGGFAQSGCPPLDWRDSMGAFRHSRIDDLVTVFADLSSCHRPTYHIKGGHDCRILPQMRD